MPCARSYVLSRGKKCAAICTVLLIALLVTRNSLAAKLCSEYRPLSNVLGTVLSLREAGTSCNVTSGLLHYAWNITPDVLLYRQIDVHCYNHKHSGSWVTTLPRSTNSSNGTASYTLPPHLLATDTVTLCVIRGCYNEFGDILKHLTNTITISCSLSDTQPEASSTATLSPLPSISASHLLLQDTLTGTVVDNSATLSPRQHTVFKSQLVFQGQAHAHTKALISPSPKSIIVPSTLPQGQAHAHTKALISPSPKSIIIPSTLPQGQAHAHTKALISPSPKSIIVLSTLPQGQAHAHTKALISPSPKSIIVPSTLPQGQAHAHTKALISPSPKSIIIPSTLPQGQAHAHTKALISPSPKSIIVPSTLPQGQAHAHTKALISPSPKSIIVPSTLPQGQKATSQPPLFPIFLPIVTLTVVITALIITVRITCHFTHTSDRESIFTHVFKMDTEFDSSMEPPPMRPFAPEMRTPYPSQASLCFKDEENPRTALRSNYEFYHNILTVPESPSPSCESSSSEGGVEIDVTESACSGALETGSGLQMSDCEHCVSDKCFSFEALTGTQGVGPDGGFERADRAQDEENDREEGDSEGEGGGEGNTDESAGMSIHFQFCDIPSSSCDTPASQCLQFHTSSSGYVTDTYNVLPPFGTSLFQVEHTIQPSNSPTLASQKAQIPSCANENDLELSNDELLQSESSTYDPTPLVLPVSSHQELKSTDASSQPNGFHNALFDIENSLESISSEEELDLHWDQVQCVGHSETLHHSASSQLLSVASSVPMNCVQSTPQEQGFGSAFDSATSGSEGYIQDCAGYNWSGGTTGTSMTSSETSSGAYFTAPALRIQPKLQD